MEDLFSSAGQTLQIVHDDWLENLSKQERDNLQLVLDKVNAERVVKTIYPDRQDVLRAFKVCPPSEVKVVILGQDPYHDDNANGFAFGVKFSETPSLRIFKQQLDYEYGKLTVLDESLHHWAYQGVLLINTILTVRKGMPLSHQNIGWEKFTVPMIKIVNKIDRPVVWLMFGKHAAEYNRYITNPKHKILEFEHPAFLARTGRECWYKPVFKEVNMALTAKGIEPINWRLNEEKEE